MQVPVFKNTKIKVRYIKTKVQYVTVFDDFSFVLWRDDGMHRRRTYLSPHHIYYVG